MCKSMANTVFFPGLPTLGKSECICHLPGSQHQLLTLSSTLAIFPYCFYCIAFQLLTSAHTTVPDIPHALYCSGCSTQGKRSPVCTLIWQPFSPVWLRISGGNSLSCPAGTHVVLAHKQRLLKMACDSYLLDDYLSYRSLDVL